MIDFPTYEDFCSEIVAPNITPDLEREIEATIQKIICVCNGLLNGPYTISDYQETIIRRCVDRVFEPYIQSYDPEKEQFEKSLYPTFKDFYKLLSDQAGYDAYDLRTTLDGLGKRESNESLLKSQEVNIDPFFSTVNQVKLNEAIENYEAKSKKKEEARNMKVTLLNHSPNPELYIAAAAKLCYSSSDIPTLLDNLTPEKTEAFLQKLTDMGHESPIEHVTFTFGIEGVSRSLLAQITRHRIASFSVQSQRYVMETNMQYVTPPEIAAIPQAAERYQKAMKDAEQAYLQLTDILKEKHLKEMLASGMSEKAANSVAEKKAIEDARFVLPNACETKMIVTMNARSLYNFFHLRCCSRAQWEIREVATEMLRLVKEVSPTLFRNSGPRCVCGPCPEGKMSCGKAAEMREFFKAM